jgi:plasmid stabilization system protein ParE
VGHLRKPFTVLFEPRATREAEEARAWLLAHRGSTRTFHAALARTLDRLTLLPRSSPRMQRAGCWTWTRRAPLGRTGYNLYYRPNIRAKIIRVISIWHERRPELRL